MRPCPVKAGRGEGLFGTKAQLNPQEAKGLASCHIPRMDVFVVEERVVHRVKSPRHIDALGQHTAVRFRVLEIRLVPVPSGFQSCLEFPFFSPGPLHIGLCQPTHVLIVLRIECQDVFHHCIVGQRTVQEVVLSLA